MAYQTILHITLSHTYTSAQAKDLYTLALSPATQAWMERLPMLWRPLNHGYALLADVDHPGYTLMQERHANHCLYLECLPQVDWFINATDLPMGPKAAPYAFAGNAEEAVRPFGESPYFTWLRGGLSYSQEEAIGAWELRNMQGSPALSGDAAGGKQLRVDMHELEAGFYSLWIEGTFINRFYYGGLSQRPFAVLALPLERLPAKGEAPVNYTWTLEARSSYRKYFLISRGRELENISLSAETVGEAPAETLPEGLEFSTPEPSTVPNGKEALLTTTSAPLPLRDSYNYVVRLRASGLREPIALPHAQPNTIFPDRETDKIYSVIYVYL